METIFRPKKRCDLSYAQQVRMNPSIDGYSTSSAAKEAPNSFHTNTDRAVRRLRGKDSIEEHVNRHTSKPYLLSGLDIGPCTKLWTTRYLKEQVGNDKPTIIHSATSPYLSFHTKNFEYSTVPFGQLLDSAVSGAHVYLRALSTVQPSKTPSSLTTDYPGLCDDFTVPEVLSFANKHRHSSVLRISGDTSMWLHYDVMSNILCQVTGSKRVLLFPPWDVSHLSFAPGETTSRIDVFRTRPDTFAECSPLEAVLNEGDVLFIPACWPHATAPVEQDAGLTVAVNVFFKSLDDKHYAAGRDVYGNRDLGMYQNGRKHIEQLRKVLGSLGLEEKRSVVTKHARTLRDGSRADDNLRGGKEINRIVLSSKQLPDELASFYLLRLGDEVEALVQKEATAVA